MPTDRLNAKLVSLALQHSNALEPLEHDGHSSRLKTTNETKFVLTFPLSDFSW
jgi:hypothetical protein